MLKKRGSKTFYSFDENESWFGVDLDGTLAYLDTSIFPEIGTAVPEVLSRVKKLLEAGKRVKIFTARFEIKGEVERIKKWLKNNNLPMNLEITNVKDMKCVEIWDDKARRVLFNLGYFTDTDIDENLNKMLEEFQQNQTVI